MALPAGFPPASFRLEDGCLMCSATAAFNWSARQDLHLRSLGPKPSVLLLHYALKLLTKIFLGIVGVGNRAAENLGTRRRGKIEIGGSEGTCTLSLPADNGLLR